MRRLIQLVLLVISLFPLYGQVDLIDGRFAESIPNGIIKIYNTQGILLETK